VTLLLRAALLAQHEGHGFEKKAVVATRMVERLDRDRLCNELLNTSVMAALIGGFALGHLDRKDVGIVEDESIPLLVYVLNVICVHLCTW